jgi:hypothetical protein
MKFDAEASLDYMNFRCAICRGDIACAFEGYDPAMPRFTFSCRKCGVTGTYKMQFQLWQGLPQKAARPRKRGH